MAASPSSSDSAGAAPSPGREEDAPPRRSLPIVLYLVVLSVVTLVPAFGFSAYLLQRNNQAQEEIVRTLTVATTRAVVQSVEREVGGMISTLRVLASSVSLDEGDLRDFHNRTQAALFGSGTFLILTDGDFNQIINTRVPYGTELGRVSEDLDAQRVLEDGATVISNIFFGGTAQRWVFNVMMPAFADDPARGLLILTQNADNLSAALLTNRLPEGWQAALIDRDGRLVASSQSAAEIGEAFFLPLDELSARSNTEWVRYSTGERTYQTIVQRSTLTGWSLVAWAPVSVAAQPLADSVAMLVLGGAAIGMLVIGLAFLLSRQIAGPVRGLARDARRLGAGQAVESADYPVTELAVVSRALAEAGQRRQSSEAEIRLLMRELAHRSKNQLSVIGSMANQTAQGADNVEQFLDTFQKRLVGLARSTDLLLAHGVAGISINSLIATQLEPFRPESAERVHIRGPELNLSVQASQILGMAMHELSTNAAKYGAFAGAEGTLRVTWKMDRETLTLTWRERSPAATTATGDRERKGFGTTVIQSMVGSSLNADVVRKMHGDGIEWCFDIPLERVLPHHGEDAKADAAE